MRNFSRFLAIITAVAFVATAVLALFGLGFLSGGFVLEWRRRTVK